ncbi:uncharacterized protein LOC111050857 [Nilaparvata lugens]|uniref:uncharacterized protein LOC111050857 n=1 Tax=Nilaparvata lugens TaxID=108931 RepID=UPI00193CC59F|nr:uncharacterized protein LOC111050857 [Nilaparvata lugens]
MNWMVKQIPYFEIIRFGMNAGNNNDTQALNDEYFGNFTQEYWTCLKTGDETPKYSRITTKSRVIVKCDAHTLKSIQFTFVDDVRLELLESTGASDNSKYDITYEGVRYYRNDGGDDQRQIINIDFGGYFILESTPSGQVWTSGTINLKKPPSSSKVTVHVDETQQVYYSDGNRGREYRFHLPGDQTSKEWQEKRMMRIGEINKVQQKIRLPPGTPSLQCYENTTIAGTADSDIRLQMLVQTFNYSSQGNAAGFHQQYYAANTRVWKCISTAGQIEILRVMNNFVVKAAEVEKIRTILYSDGVAIFSDLRNVGILEIAEVKFLNAEDYSRLKYDGALEFESSSENVGLHSIELHYPKIQDVNYILNDNEFFKTTFPAVLGDTLEIREPHPGMKSDEDKKGTRFQETIRCDEFVGESFFSEEVRNNVIKPKVILLQQKAKKKEIPPSIITDLPMYFDDIKKTIRRCEEEGTSSTKLYRVQTQMKLKTKIRIRHIFHQNGVKIHEDYNGRHMIEITSYFEKKTIEHQSAFVPVQFEGLVILPLLGLQEKFKNDAKNPQNHLDKPILQFSALSREEGVTYLVQSEFHSTIDNSEGGIVACLKYEDKNTAQADYMQTKILVNENSNKQKPKKTWNEVDRRNTDHILYESYEAWSCKYQEDDFTRVVNKMLVKDTARVYYPDGVEVQRLILLNGETYIQIKHVRFFKSEQGKIHAIKFIGRLHLEIPSLPGLEKMLSSPPFNIQVIGKQDEEKEPSPYRPRYIFTWDSMRYAAFKDLGKRSDGINQSPPIRFSSHMDSLQTKFLNARSSRIFQLGRFWNEKLNSEGTVTMKCFVYLTANLRAMKYTISPEDAKIKYNPRVAEYIDQTLYTFTQDEFDEIFTITGVRTWYCTDKTDEFLKVQTFYNTTTIPFAVRYTDGVEVKLENENLKITETVYINMMNSRVYNRQQNRRKEGDLMEFVIYPSQNKQRAQTAQTGKGKGNNIKERTPTCCG